MTTLLHEDLRELALEFAQDTLSDIEYIRIVEAIEDRLPGGGVVSEEDVDFVIDTISVMSAGLRPIPSWDEGSVDIAVHGGGVVRTAGTRTFPRGTLNLFFGATVEEMEREERERRELLDELAHLANEHHGESVGFYRLAGQQALDGDMDAGFMNASQAQLHEHTARALRLAYEELAK